MKKTIFLFFAAILCATNAWGAKLFFDHSSVNYPADGALVAIWSWGGSSSDAWSVFKASGATNKIVADIADGRTGGKIVRFTSSVTKPDWSASKWNSTGDISFPSDKNCIKITSWDGATTGTWSKFQLESQASITPSASSVSVGEEVTFTPALTSNQEYNDVLSTTYSVDAGATITNGKFVATEAGTYTVTATVTYNAQGYTNITKTATATCSITVSAVAVPHPVTGVTVAPTSVTIKQGATTTLTATVAPSNADNLSVTWSSDNTSVATVVNGVVTAVAAGTANITVTTVDGGFTATCAVKVKPSQYTFHAINSAQWPTVAAHYWGGADGGSSWPGADMVKELETINGFDIYSITISSDFINIMFTNQLNGDDKNKKTADLTTEGNNGKYYDIKEAKWYASLSEVPVSYDYYLAGSMNGWATNNADYGMDLVDDVYKKELEFAKDAEFKVTNGTDWYGFADVDSKYQGVSDKDGNIKVDAAATFTVVFNKTTKKITFDGLTKIEDYYTVVGSSDELGLAWDPTKKANDMEKQDDGSYKKVYSNVELTTSVEWKLAKNGAWWNETPLENKADNGNSVLTISKSGIYNVTFTLSKDLKTAHAEAELLEETNTVADCFVSGNAALTGGAGWAGNEFKMEYDDATETYSYTFTGLATDKAYELKIVLGGAWHSYADLASVPAGVTQGNDDAIAFKMAAAGDVVVTYNVEDGITLSGNFALPVTYDYYLTGTLVGGWSAKQQGLEKDGELYKATFTELNAGTYQFKITDGQFNTEEDKTHEHTTLAAEYKEVSYVDGNIQFVTEEAKNIIVIFDATANKITIEGLTKVTHTYTIAGDAALCGEAWNWALEANDMTNNGDGTYTWTKAGVEVNGELSFKVFVDHKSETAYPAENWVIKPENYGGVGVYDVTITFTESSKEIAVALTKQVVAPTIIDVTLSGMVKTPVSRMGSYRFLSLDDEDGNQISIFNGTEGAYGDFDVDAYLVEYDVTVAGNGTWAVVDGVETLTATLQVEYDNTTIYNVTATVGAATTITLECYDATYTITDPELNEVTFTGIADGKEFSIVVSPEGAGYYSDGEWDGTPILGTSVEFDDSDAESYYLAGTYIDEAGNTYDVLIFGAPAPTPDYTRTVTAGKFGTLCLPFGGTVEGAELFECVGSEPGKVYLGSVTTLVAGVPYIFQATATELAVYSDGTTAVTAGKSNGLYGTFDDETPVDAGNYILLNNELRPSDGTAKVNANRAYLVMSEVSGGAPQQMPGRRYIGMSVQGENEATGLDNIATSENAVKVINNGQLIIIRGGEKFNAQGQKL